MILRFPKLNDNQHAYTVHSSSMDLYNSHGNISRLADFAGQYDVLGDGMTAHSPYYAVPKDQFNIYLGSLAAHLLAVPADLEIFERNCLWPRREEDRKIEFAFSVIYRAPDEKNKFRYQYFSLNERKVSLNAEKQHDKRWARVPEFADGSVQSAFGLLRPEFRSDALSAFALYEQCRDWSGAHDHGWGEGAASFLKLTAEHGSSNEDSAFHMVDCLIRATELHKAAKRSMSCWSHNSKVTLPESIATLVEAA